MNNSVKLLLGAGVVYVGWKLYKIYQIGEQVKYEPVGFDFANKTLYVKMKLTNPVNQSLKMKGVDGILSIKGSQIATFTSAPFIIGAGINYFTLAFKINSLESAIEFLNAFNSKTIPELYVMVRKRTEFTTLSESFKINANK